MALFLGGELSMDTFMHHQVNLWFTVRSAILRALHMMQIQVWTVTPEDLSPAVTPSTFPVSGRSWRVETVCFPIAAI